VGGLSKNREDFLRTPIFLLGFMGTGKSTVGSILAEALALPFLDLDETVQEEAGMSIEAIFALEGEEGFRQRETEVLKRAVSFPGVVAAGGGVVTVEENWDYLKEGVTVALTASLEVLKRRLNGKTGRPLLGDEMALEKLFMERISLYEKARLVVDTSLLSPEEVMNEILMRIKE